MSGLEFALRFYQKDVFVARRCAHGARKHNEVQLSTLGHIGFGCAYLLAAGLTMRQALALVETALDSGIRHFDTARMYGHGEAEALLGDVARRRREDMFIVTKAGIEPPSLMSRMARRALGAAGLDAANLGQPVKHAFAPRQVRRSVETSLRELKTDYVDALLLHDIAPADVTQALKDEVSALKLEGKIRRIGVATSAAEAAVISAAHPEICELTQLPAPPWSASSEASDPARIMHSVLGGRLSHFLEVLASNEDAARRFEAEVGVAASDRSAVANLFLQRALADNPSGVTLFSSTRREHIVQNATSATDVNAPQVAAFAAFVRQLPSDRVTTAA